MIDFVPTLSLPPAVASPGDAFTVFTHAQDAIDVAEALAEEFARNALDTRFVVSIRTDGKFLVTAIENEDGATFCWHALAAMAKPFAGPVSIRII